jgi:RNA polymerase sigma-70 factor (ECF subfamily)
LWEVIVKQSAFAPPETEQRADPLCDQPTIELVLKAKSGDHMAVEVLLQRCLPPLKRWAHGRLPAAARGLFDTGDLVQEAAFHAVARLETFEPRQVGGMQAYLRKAVINRIRDEMRRVGRRPASVELSENHASDQTTPLEAAIRREIYRRYCEALLRLRSKDRRLIVARVELHWGLDEIARRFGLPSAAAARMAVNRALRRLESREQCAARRGPLTVRDQELAVRAGRRGAKESCVEAGWAV